jgi:hypothetical protein
MLEVDRERPRPAYVVGDNRWTVQRRKAMPPHLCLFR